jgi:hypothetical protein
VVLVISALAYALAYALQYNTTVKRIVHAKDRFGTCSSCMRELSLPVPAPTFKEDRIGPECETASWPPSLPLLPVPSICALRN